MNYGIDDTRGVQNPLDFFEVENLWCYDISLKVPVQALLMLRVCIFRFAACQETSVIS